LEGKDANTETYNILTYGLGDRVENSSCHALVTASNHSFGGSRIIRSSATSASKGKSIHLKQKTKKTTILKITDHNMQDEHQEGHATTPESCEHGY